MNFSQYKGLLVGILGTISWGSTGFGYQLTAYDHQILQPAISLIEQATEEGRKEDIVFWISRLQQVENKTTHERVSTILDYLEAYLFWQFDLAVHGTGNLATYRQEEVIVPPVDEMPATPDDMLVDGLTEHEQSFYMQYWTQVTSGEEPLLEQCFTYFDQIDAVAREYNFPTPLIIATRYKEHTCHFDNPGNGRGNFQITSHYYEPGPITWEAFEQQIINFIEFSRAKWKRYDNLQLRDEVSIAMTYDQYDLQSIRKHAILYNGIKKGTTPETNDYANRNFGNGPDGRDGIVATFLKVLDREVKR